MQHNFAHWTFLSTFLQIYMYSLTQDTKNIGRCLNQSLLLRELVILYHLLFIILIPLVPRCLPVFSVAEGPQFQHSCWGRIQIFHEVLLHTSSHRFDWPIWWCHPPGSPARHHSLAQSHTGPYSKAQLKKETQRHRDGKGRERRGETKKNPIQLFHGNNFTSKSWYVLLWKVFIKREFITSVFQSTL